MPNRKRARFFGIAAQLASACPLACMKSRIRQTTFKQFNWGGKRRGAGRKPKGERAGVSHAKRPEINPRHPLHVTLKLEAGISTLRSWN